MQLRRIAAAWAGMVCLTGLAGIAALAAAETVEEKFPDGKTKLKYSTDKDGKKSGAYAEFYETGKPKVKANYAADQLSGPYSEYFENGKAHITAGYRKGQYHGEFTERNEQGQTVLNATYKDGKFDGLVTKYEKGKPVSAQGYKDGTLVYPKGLDFIKRKLAEIGGSAPAQAETGPRPSRKGPTPAPAAGSGDAAAALQRLKAYRFLADVPYDDLVLDDEQTRHAEAGAKLCARIGKLDHTPANPGMPEDEYKFAYKGTSSSNLYMGSGSLPPTVDGYMDDSDPSNIDRVGHRRWCINPRMAKTGFGMSGRFSAMWSFDQSRTDTPDYDFVCWPPRGFLPTAYFSQHHAWNISLNPAKYRKADDSVKVKVFAADGQMNKAGPPLKQNYFKINNDGFGIPICVIFRPEAAVAAGKRYWVEIEGVKKSDGSEAEIRYLVEFVN